MAAPWNFENAAHLLRRAAFGGTNEEIQAFLDSYASVAEAVEGLLSFSVSSKKPPAGGRDFYKANRKQQQWWLKTMLKAKSPRDALREKMVLFWHGHLCSGVSKQPEPAYMAIQNGLFRRYAGGNFRDLVRDFNRDPANLYYLDGIVNYATIDGETVAANENFGRELMELFTIGISELAADGTNDPSRPNYSEDDVHQLARALTGWVEIDKDVGVWRDWAWDGGQYDDDADGNPDDITIFGVTNNNFKIGAEVAGTADDVLDLVLSQTDLDGNNQTAMFLARKLWSFFAYPPPEAGYKARLVDIADTFVTNNWELIPVLRAIFNHDDFYSDAAKTRAVKSPVDYMVGAFKTLGVKSSGKAIGESDELYDMLSEMGMLLFEPPNVAGWPGGLRWITTGTLVARLEFARRLAESDYGSSVLRLSSFPGMPLGNDMADPAVVADVILARLGLDGSSGPLAFTPAQRTALIDYMSSGGATLDLTDEYTNDAERLVRGAIALALQSAEAQVF